MGSQRGRKGIIDYHTVGEVISGENDSSVIGREKLRRVKNKQG